MYVSLATLVIRWLDGMSRLISVAALALFIAIPLVCVAYVLDEEYGP